jgi:hypothetical protein
MTYEVEETRRKGRPLELHHQFAPREEAEAQAAGYRKARNRPRLIRKPL